MSPQNSAIPLDSITLGRLEKVDGAENMGGMTTKAYLFLNKQIASWPTEKANPANPADLVTLEGNVVMVDGKYAVEVEPVIDSSEFKYENQGEPEGQSFHPVAAFKLPGATVEDKMGWARILNNTLGAYVAIDNYGKRIWMGNENRPVSFKPSGSTGAKPADFSHMVIEVHWDAFAPGYIYNGSIPLSATETIPEIAS